MFRWVELSRRHCTRFTDELKGAVGGGSADIRKQEWELCRELLVGDDGWRKHMALLQHATRGSFSPHGSCWAICDLCIG